MYVYRRKYNSEIVDIMKRNTVPKDNLDLYTYIDGIVYYTMFLWYNLLTSNLNEYSYIESEFTTKYYIVELFFLRATR